MTEIDSKQIVELLEGSVYYGAEKRVKEVKQITDKFNNSSLSWCGEKYLEHALRVQSGLIIINSEGHEKVRLENQYYKNVSWLVVSNPRRAFARVLQAFFVSSPKKGIIEKSSKCDDTVVIGSDCYIGANVVIEENCQIGNNVVILHNTVVLSGTIISDNVKIGCNCTIGGVGFGYELDDNGEYQIMPHIGNVVLEKNVEIGNNACIDRAVIGETLISNNVKIDNLVHIAHGVKIDSNSLIIANAMVAGSVEIGKNVWVAPSSSIIQKVKIGDNSLIGLSSTVLKDVDENSVMVGSPAKKIKSK